MAPRTQFPYPDATSSPTAWADITPNDDADLAQAFRAIWVGVGGDISLQGADGEVSVFKNVPDGYLLIISPTRVMEATTATDLVGMP